MVFELNFDLALGEDHSRCQTSHLYSDFDIFLGLYPEMRNFLFPFLGISKGQEFFISNEKLSAKEAQVSIDLFKYNLNFFYD